MCVEVRQWGSCCSWRGSGPRHCGSLLAEEPSPGLKGVAVGNGLSELEYAMVRGRENHVCIWPASPHLSLRIPSFMSPGMFWRAEQLCLFIICPLLCYMCLGCPSRGAGLELSVQHCRACLRRRVQPLVIDLERLIVPAPHLASSQILRWTVSRVRRTGQPVSIAMLDPSSVLHLKRVRRNKWAIEEFLIGHPLKWSMIPDQCQKCLAVK